LVEKNKYGEDWTFSVMSAAMACSSWDSEKLSALRAKFLVSDI
jgi:hypothetical protein